MICGNEGVLSVPISVWMTNRNDLFVSNLDTVKTDQQQKNKICFRSKNHSIRNKISQPFSDQSIVTTFHRWNVTFRRAILVRRFSLDFEKFCLIIRLCCYSFWLFGETLIESRWRNPSFISLNQTDRNPIFQKCSLRPIWLTLTDDTPVSSNWSIKRTWCSWSWLNITILWRFISIKSIEMWN